MDVISQISRAACALLFFLFVAPNNSFSAEPTDSWSQLTDPAFETRELGQKNLLNWSLENIQEAKDFLCAHYFQTHDPEVQRRLRDILKKTFGNQRSAYLGLAIEAVDVSPQFAPNERGVTVLKVNKNGSGKLAGIYPKDIIIAVGDYEVKKSDQTSDVVSEIKKLRAGEKIIMKIVRKEKILEVNVPLIPRPGSETLSPAESERLFETWLAAQKKEHPVFIGPPNP